MLLASTRSRFSVSIFSVSMRLLWRGRGKRSYGEHLGYFHLSVFEGMHKCFHHRGIEICSRTGDDHLLGLEWRDGPAIRPVAGQSVKRVGHRQNSGFERYLVPFRRTISRPVVLVVVGKNDGEYAA